MRKTREILRLAQESGLSNRQVARSLNVSATTVGECLKRAREAGITCLLRCEGVGRKNEHPGTGSQP